MTACIDGATGTGAVSQLKGADMRLVNFIAVAVVISIGVGVWSTLTGAGVIASIVNAVLAMFALQVAYFVFLVVKSLLPQEPKPDGKADDAADQYKD